MNFGRIVSITAVLILFTVPLFAQEDNVPSSADGYIRLNAVDRDNWQIVEFGGEGVYPSTGQSSIYLLEGNEYYFDLSEVDSEHFPVDIVSTDGTVLLSQREDAVTQETEGVNASADEDGISFTLTEELAERIARFRASSYPGMVGFISTLSEEPTQEPADEEEETEEAETEEEDE
ncbi:MAG: hypothetical protein ACLFUM_11195 [Spirochaetaceae bacterium]